MRSLTAASRAGAIARHMATSSASPPRPDDKESPVTFSEKFSLRQFTLNRPQKLNTLDMHMLELLSPVLAYWEQAELPSVIMGTGSGRAFCAGGDVAVITENLDNAAGRENAIRFFQREFGLDYFLALLSTPYVAVMDGITFGGGFGLAAAAAFRVATEKTLVAMPETKIGYFPDVGASYYLSRLDGEIVSGRTAFELGLATHYIPSNRISILSDRLAMVEKVSFEHVNNALNELHGEREPSDPPSRFLGAIRNALDDAFSQRDVQGIIDRLNLYGSGEVSGSSAEVVRWAKDTLNMLEDRSPTSLKVALKAVRKGKTMSLLEAFDMEMGMASVYCTGSVPDFKTGVSTVIREKLRTRPAWTPSTLADVPDVDIEKTFFEVAGAKRLQLEYPPFVVDRQPRDPMAYALPTEERIRRLVKGEDKKSTGTALTLEELLKEVDNLTGFKPGTRDKVLETIDRKCVLDEGVYLRWK
ncbi:3-hydroxyisobutyryl-coenzyme A hydrolase [Vararia minispora EC-137]|uniref:3-hydroxyisobutyryl-coenzyme A hydrolase n=1 Tax=Vararia minispora EC-137 TaxID=1314806 RepID=A0ACB8QMD6_9AGAM|nr:3-hydroxyisobutyryl-coenzyme A hydrolase [Vararia minispora EC-137]